jgi:hypothetical protein
MGAPIGDLHYDAMIIIHSERAMPTSFWPQIDALQGYTLHTLGRANAFMITRVGNGEVEVLVCASGKARVFYRKDLEPLWHKLVTAGVLSVSELRTVYRVNSSLAAALLAACQGVSATTNPIILHYVPLQPTK